VVCKQLTDNPVFAALDKLDQLTVFRDWVIDMEKKVEEAKKMEKRTGERKAREAFRALLKEKIEAGELTVCTHWRPFVHSLQDHSAYLSLVGQVGSTPKELFDDAVEQLREQAQTAKDIVLRACADAKLELGPAVKLEEVLSKLPSNLEPDSEITRKTLEDVAKWQLEEATVDQRNKARKKKKHEKLFDDFLHSLALSSQSTLQDFKSELAEARPKFKRLSDTELNQLFSLYVEKIKVLTRQEDEKLMEIEPGEIKKKSHRNSEHRHSKHKHHKKHKRHSSSSSIRKRHKHHSPSPPPAASSKS
jgi:pre-mRNA-processing factor 40